MKNSLLLLAKWAIFAVFVWNTGIIQALYQVEKPEKNRTYQEQILLEKQYRDFWAAAHKKALAKDQSGEGYSPADYFADLTASHLSFGEESLGMDYSLTKCQELMRGGRKFSNDDLTSARDNFYFATGQAEKMSKNHKPVPWTEVFWTVAEALWGFYLHNLFFALLLFVLWDMKRGEKFALKNPLSAALNALLHPVTLSIIFCQYISQKVLEAEFRRTTEKLLTVLSEDELALLRQAIGRKMSRREWQNFLAQKGLVVRRSLVWAMMGMILVSILPQQFAVAESLSAAPKKEVLRLGAILQIQIASANNVSQSHASDLGQLVGLLEDFIGLLFFMIVLFIHSFFILFKEQKVFRKIKHIPLLHS